MWIEPSELVKPYVKMCWLTLAVVLVRITSTIDHLTCLYLVADKSLPVVLDFISWFNLFWHPRRYDRLESHFFLTRATLYKNKFGAFILWFRFLFRIFVLVLHLFVMSPACGCANQTVCFNAHYEILWGHVTELYTYGSGIFSVYVKVAQMEYLDDWQVVHHFIFHSAKLPESQLSQLITHITQCTINVNN